MKKQFKGTKYSGSKLQFALDQKLPKGIYDAMLQARVNENLEKFRMKKS